MENFMKYFSGEGTRKKLETIKTFSKAGALILVVGLAASLSKSNELGAQSAGAFVPKGGPVSTEVVTTSVEKGRTVQRVYKSTGEKIAEINPGNYKLQGPQKDPIPQGFEEGIEHARNVSENMSEALNADNQDVITEEGEIRTLNKNTYKLGSTRPNS